MRWIIGIELRHRSVAALQFGRWLAEATGARWAEDFVAVHVLDANHLAAVLRTRHLDEVVEEARAAAEDEVRRATPRGRGPRVEIVQELTIPDGLFAARGARGAHGVIVARVGRRESGHLLRLGDVGRALLRRLPGPVAVVPPGFTARAAGDGPIVALTGLGDDALPACRAAARLAERSGRALAMAHVSDDPHAGAALARWSERHEVWPDAASVLAGDLTEAGLAFSEARRAALLAIGAGPRTGLRRRLVGPPLATRLTAAAELPVLVVPHDWRDPAFEEAAPRVDRLGGAPPGAPPGPPP
jgi:nucleotide-binding universal stress UspA family protein